MTDKFRSRLATASQWLSALIIPLASGAAALAADGHVGGLDVWSAAARGQFAFRMFLIEVAFIVIAAPVAGVLAAKPRQSPDASLPLATRELGLLRGAWQLARPLIAGATMLAATSAVMVLVLAPAIDPATLAISHAVLWAAALLLAALGAMCAAVCAESLDAAACALGVALFVGLGLFATGPVLSVFPRRVLDVALAANPIVASASAANVDIFRTEPFYRLSPLAHIQIDYPTPGTAFVWYALIAAVLFVGSARGLARRASDPPFERMSA